MCYLKELAHNVEPTSSNLQFIVMVNGPLYKHTQCYQLSGEHSGALGSLKSKYDTVSSCYHGSHCTACKTLRPRPLTGCSPYA